MEASGYLKKQSKLRENGSQTSNTIRLNVGQIVVPILAYSSPDSLQLEDGGTVQEMHPTPRSACTPPGAGDAPLESTSIEPAQKEPLPKTARARDEIIDTLAEIEGINLKELNGKVGGRLAVAKKAILQSTPKCNRDELLRRARKYRVDHPTWTLTANALASHWAELSDESVPFSVNLQEEQLNKLLGR